MTTPCIMDAQERREARLSRRRERERRNRALESAEEREARLARRRVLKGQSSASCTVYCSLASQISLVPRSSRPGYEARARRVSVNACARMRSRKYVWLARLSLLSEALQRRRERGFRAEFT